jgi:hypothetical protein
VQANKITALGFATLASSYPLYLTENYNGMYATLGSGFIISSLTAFSVNTYIAYKPSKKSFETHGFLPIEYSEK